jgi:oligopeptide/dipeptide ABC transporter ATP-binding protein
MLLATVPSLHPDWGRKRMTSIPGQLPDLATIAAGCPFVARCSFAREECRTLAVTLDAPVGRHASACPYV